MTWLGLVDKVMNLGVPIVLLSWLGFKRELEQMK